MEPSITILTTEAKNPDQFEAMSLGERREGSVGWKKFPLRSGIYLDSFLMSAIGGDWAIFDSAEKEVDDEGIEVKTRLLVNQGIDEIVQDLQTGVELKPDDTARALVKHGGGTADLVRVTEALTTGSWPSSNDPAEEAAAFAFQLLKHARHANNAKIGICFEYRGTSID